ncbi:uncharacterized protein LOC122331639 [Puntigrus tetrazona]|uniref:uncharacterized protein LOC122331639 n=1 Tax=Puntigrus tetrazona TaxID=1606681 RepID=UPI001C897843|nr:uncharacterized protein LOC122331639 [Puntigrus tetrazona]
MRAYLRNQTTRESNPPEQDLHTGLHHEGENEGVNEEHEINVRNKKYDESNPEKLLSSNREVIVKLAELAFRQLMKGNVIFYEEDLIESGIDLAETAVYSGICTEIIKKESVICQKKVYCFVHLSFQEFLAAFYVFYIYKYNATEKSRRRLIPAVINCKKALLAGCNLTDQSCEIVISALKSSGSPLRELDLSDNDLQDPGVKRLSDGLKNPNCCLEILRLSGCMVTEKGCDYLALAINSNPSHLIELDLSYNHPGDSGVKLLSEKLEDPNCSLKKLNLSHGDSIRIKPGLRKYACDLTLDLNTANSHLILSENNRKVTCVEEEQSYPDRPERFNYWHQVLSRESLAGRCYWEVECSGKRDCISVTYEGISRKDASKDCYFGYNEKSWALNCSNYTYTVCHNDKETVLKVLSPPSNRIGVYLDILAGTLSFYIVSDTHTLTHLHTFSTTFTEPVYVGLGTYESVSFVKL